jgi:CBS domain-containing protein
MSDQKPTRRPIRLKVGDVMSRDVVTISVDTPFKQIEQLMSEQHISALPVLSDEGALVGVVSEADLLLRTEAAADDPGGWRHDARERKSKSLAQTAAGLMTAPAVSVTQDLPLAAAARLMRKRNVKRLPVVDGDRLVGIVSRADVLKSYLRTDADLRADVVEGVIRGSMWLDPSGFDVTVDEGVVRIHGELDRRSDVDILTRLILGVEGVIDVDPSLTSRFDDRGVAPPKELGGI